jgi:hypothetical protein
MRGAGQRPWKHAIGPNINIQTIRCRTWSRASDFLMGIRGSYIFRGQGEDLPFGTRLDRSSLSNLAVEMEATLLSTFKAAAHLYQQNLPAAAADLSWLALTQHHGLPTRLLDWTASPLIAAFFAAEHYPHRNANRGFVVWALDLNWLRRTAKVNCDLEDTPAFSDPAIFKKFFIGQLRVFRLCPQCSVRLKGRSRQVGDTRSSSLGLSGSRLSAALSASGSAASPSFQGLTGLLSLSLHNRAYVRTIWMAQLFGRLYAASRSSDSLDFRTARARRFAVGLVHDS